MSNGNFEFQFFGFGLFGHTEWFLLLLLYPIGDYSEGDRIVNASPTSQAVSEEDDEEKDEGEEDGGKESVGGGCHAKQKSGRLLPLADARLCEREYSISDKRIFVKPVVF